MLGTRKIGQILDAVGLAGCAPEIRQTVLRVTLVSAAQVNRRSGFYLEVWCEPSDAYPKNSRVHQPSSGTIDLGCEQLELDWVGDEREVVINAVDYGGTQQHRDIPFGGLRIPVAAVHRYAKEAQRAEHDLRYGTRMFEMSAIEKHDAIQRRRRFQDVWLPKDWFASIVSKVGAENGVHIPSPDEVERLRDENRSLRKENATLRTSTGSASSSHFACGSNDPKSSPVCLAVRFEFVSKAAALPSIPRMASFQQT